MKILQTVALCVVVIGCTGSAWAGAESTPGRYPQHGDGTAMWAAAPEEDSGLSWKQVLLLLTACSGTGALCWQGSKKMHTLTKIEPQPLEVSMSKDYVTRSEFEDYRKQVGSDFERVHKRLDTVMPAVAEIKGELKQIAQKQTQILNLLLNGKASE